MKKLNKLIAGFTLVELMVVVAIIGILSSVAIPNFKKYQAKAKASEAKLVLASLYTAETSFLGDYDTFATCIGDMGLSSPARGYYSFGFSTDDTTSTMVAATTAGAACASGKNKFQPDVIVKVGGTNATTTNLGDTGITTSVSGSAFVSAAVGRISADATVNDAWTINENKVLQHPVSGI